MLKSVISVIALAASVIADPVKFRDCGSVSGTIQSVSITPCPTEPCQFIRQKTVQVEVNFSANAQITAATTKVYGYIAGVKVPFPVPSDACQDMTCPISQGTAAVYQNAVYVKAEYPNVSLVVQNRTIISSSASTSQFRSAADLPFAWDLGPV